MPLPHQQNLEGSSWTVRAVGDVSLVPSNVAGRVVAASVPGCIHTDLMDAGLIRDPRIGDAETEIQWVSWVDWRYETEFEADAALFERDEIDLVFEHLDTIATIELNGVEIGKASSEFLPWRFSVVGVLVKGTNRLAVTFTSPLQYVKEESARLGSRPVNGDYPAYNMIRKCASNFEWDWGPRVATCGIAGEVRLEGWDTGKLVQASPHARVHKTSNNKWLLEIDVEFEWSKQARGDAVTLRASIGGAGFEARTEATASIGERSARLSMLLSNPAIWSPTGYGDQWIHRMRIDLMTAPTPASGYHASSCTLIDALEFNTGVREVARAQWHEVGDFFPLSVNGRPVYCRGANWIPEGLFPRDRTRERVRKRLQQLKAANMNTIRVWGGGRYEPDWFYDICDELGILVWQDFMFACACYPEEEPIRSLVEKEARFHVSRLSRHPSVALWCGGNECTWAHESWGFKEKLAPGQTWGEKYYNKILRNACSYDTLYVPNSPFSPKAGVHPNDPSIGDTHTWDVWGDGYRTVTPQFCSEFGQQGPSNIDTLAKAGLTPTGASTEMMPPLLAARQRGPGGNKRWYDDPIATWFRPPRDFDEWHYLAQLLQARSLQIAVEWQRANMPECMGSLIWQLNDAWPGLSWSLIDSEGQPKLAYHAVAAAFKNRKLTIQPIDGGLHVIAINDTAEQWTSRLRVRRMSFDGSLCVEPDTMPFSIAPRQVQRLCRVEEVVGAPGNPDFEFIVAESLKHRATWFYLPDRELRYPAPRFEAELRHDRFGFEDSLRIKSDVLLRDVVIQTERLDPSLGVFQPPPYLVLPGETLYMGINVKLAPETASLLTAEKLTSRPIFLCANSFGKPTSA